MKNLIIFLLQFSVLFSLENKLILTPQIKVCNFDKVSMVGNYFKFYFNSESKCYTPANYNRENNLAISKNKVSTQKISNIISTLIKKTHSDFRVNDIIICSTNEITKYNHLIIVNVELIYKIKSPIDNQEIKLSLLCVIEKDKEYKIIGYHNFDQILYENKITLLSIQYTKNKLLAILSYKFLNERTDDVEEIFVVLGQCDVPSCLVYNYDDLHSCLDQ